MLVAAMFAASAAFAGTPAEIHLAVRSGDVWQDAHKLTSYGNVIEARLSPDGKRLALIRRDRKADDSQDPDYNSLWLAGVSPGSQGRKLLSWRLSTKNLKANLMGLFSPVWSPDGKFVYVLSSAWGTSDAVHQVDVASGSERFVIDAGGSLKVIQDGPYKGMLLVERHTCHLTPSYCDYPVSVVRPGGKPILTIPKSGGSDREAVVSQWLRAHHWTAS
jgi:dipeptidyl aminopeptidase/acylaminoacyl peptidase